MAADVKIFGTRRQRGLSSSALRQIAHWFRPISFAAIAAGFVGWLLLFYLLQQQQHAQTERLGTVVGLVTVIGVALPFGATYLMREAAESERERTGYSQLRAALQAQLSGRWAFFQHIHLPQGGRVDGVLVGEVGVFALKIETPEAAHRTMAARWQRRNAAQQWEPAPYNATEQIEAQTKHLAHYFASQGHDVAVVPRIVWATDVLLMADNPAVPIWQLAVNDAVRDDLAQFASANLRHDVLTQLSDLLHAVSAERSS